MKSTDSNATLLDMAQAINASLATDGSNANTAAVWGVFKPITTTGGTTAYSLATGLSLTTLGTYQVFMVKWNATNTGASTLAVDGVAAAPLRKGAAAVIAGDLIAGNINTVAYDGTNFQVVEANTAQLDATLQTIAALTPTADQAIYFTGTDTAATMSFTAFGRSLAGAANSGAGLTVLNVSAYMQTLMPAADAATARATLGISTDKAPRAYIAGLTMSNNAGGTTAIDVAAGVARDSTNFIDLVASSAITNKILGTAWAAGNSQGMLDTGAIGNNTYHIYAIRKDSDSSVDVLASLSASSPTMPVGYTYFRRIGSVIRSAGAILKFVQDGDVFSLVDPVNDVADSNFGTSAVSRTLTVPNGIRVRAVMAVYSEATGGTNYGILTDLSTTDTAPTVTINSLSVTPTGGTASMSGAQSVYTNTSRQIRSRYSNAGTAIKLNITTMGWEDTRGRFA